jgi:hypothetical protein
MTEEEIEKLQGQVADLTEQVRILEARNAQLDAYIQELQSRDIVTASQKARWFGYKGSKETRGAFDMLLVSGWAGSLIQRKGWLTYVYAGTGTHTLEHQASLEFFDKFDRYIAGNTP